MPCHRASMRTLALCLFIAVLPVYAAQINDLPRPLFGTGTTTLVMAMVGSIGAFAHAGEPDRVKLFGMAAINGFLATAMVTILPLWLGWEWIKPEIKHVVEPPLGMVVAFALRWIVPLATEIGPQWARKKWGTPAPNGDKP